MHRVNGFCSCTVQSTVQSTRYMLVALFYVECSLFFFLSFGETYTFFIFMHPFYHKFVIAEMSYPEVVAVGLASSHDLFQPGVLRSEGLQ